MPDKKSVTSISDQVLESKIYFLRNQKVMMDSDLAELYAVETRVLNQAVNRNKERFPEDFMFQLDKVEWENLKSQVVISSYGGRRTLPYVFTEHGVLMLSSVLNSSKAIQVNIQVVRIFTRIRQVLTDGAKLSIEIEEIKKQLSTHGKNINAIFKYLDGLTVKKEIENPRKRIGFKSDDLL
ncbi:ORF6N domain-containing protein [Mucilaginibacter arboris]|uniref:ORF6N domain-containing protein n=1 Tax=Mucilaginibacter arboris TaxID=2682090 RepID=A0A7K1ST40_9SPHI|nr:ORF6N domain-containing protein [Mucilaginibacter arboris]MVN20270.1 ORF6N domain-containing protein [Mucilaginibacter arboris]